MKVAAEVCHVCRGGEVDGSLPVLPRVVRCDCRTKVRAEVIAGGCLREFPSAMSIASVSISSMTGPHANAVRCADGRFVQIVEGYHLEIREILLLGRFRAS